MVLADVEWDWRMVRNITVLAAAFACGQAAFFVSLASAVATSRSLDSAPYATAALGVLLLATALTSPVAAATTRRFGRKAPACCAAALGAIGALGAYAAVRDASLALFVLSFVPQGIAIAFVNHFRFAVSDIASPSFRPYALAIVVVTTLAAAIVAPELAQAGCTLATERYSGIYLINAVLFAVVALAVLFVNYTPYSLPSASDAGESGEYEYYSEEEEEEEAGGRAAPKLRSLSAIFAQPRFLIGLSGQTAAYCAMAVLMVGAPIAIGNDGHSFATTTRVVQAFILGMHFPSLFVTRSVLAKLGSHVVSTLGFVLLVAGTLVLLIGRDVAVFVVGLVVAGAGWNFAFIACSQLLTHWYAPAEASKVAGAGDLVVFAAAGIAVAATGAVVDATSWLFVVLCALALAIAATIILASNWMHHVHVAAPAKVLRSAAARARENRAKRRARRARVRAGRERDAAASAAREHRHPSSDNDTFRSYSVDSSDSES